MYFLWYWLSDMFKANSSFGFISLRTTYRIAKSKIKILDDGMWTDRADDGVEGLQGDRGNSEIYCRLYISIT